MNCEDIDAESEEDLMRCNAILSHGTHLLHILERAIYAYFIVITNQPICNQAIITQNTIKMLTTHEYLKMLIKMTTYGANMIGISTK